MGVPAAPITERIGVESRISQVLEDIAVELIRSALAHGHDLAAHGQTVFSLERAGHSLILLDSVQPQRIAGTARDGAAAVLFAGWLHPT